MEWLLKIVEGPMKGAEIALVEGIAASFGSGDDCDIIVQDATVPAKACEFEIDATGVRIAVGGGSSEPLPSYEVRSFGTTSFAVGPVDGEWQNLIKPVRPAMERADPEAADASTPVDEAARRVEKEEPAAADATAPSRQRKPMLVALLATVLLLAVAAVFVWRGSRLTRQAAVSADSAAKLSLADLAKQHGLTLERSNPSNPSNLLKGNLRRRTERLAIRALALAADSSVKFDLTDDETLFSSATELLFACSDGALKVETASNRVVVISGYAPSREALQQAIRALNADVKGIDRLDTSHVRVGGTAPAAVAKTPFVREEPPGEHPVVAIPAHTPNPPMKKDGKAVNFPIAGILTVPYPCVVMRNGVRLVEGAQIGKAVLVKIEADKLTLEDGGRKVEWKP